MVQSLLLPLHSTSPSTTWSNLETRVRQIESQKGSFRTVTEKGLQDDIEKAKAGDADIASENEESEDEDESPESKQKRLWEAREEMMKQLLRAQNETLTALDSISLLISGHSKAGPGAKSSMSPALSSAVPSSTLDAQKVRNTQLSKPAEQHNESLYMGYKLEGLQKAIDKISSARNRLSEQANHESAFWKQVADLSAQGLVISRLPRDSRVIGVHFGFPEAALRFRNRGFAVLRADQEGQLRLDQAISTSQRHTVQISILRNGKVTSCSRPPTLASTAASISTNIADLRRNLFEEELFFEMGREARTIANQRVAIFGKTITAEISDGQKMRIDLVGHNEKSTRDESTDGDIADGILLCLRGLLSRGHEQSLARRSQPPAPLVPKSPPLPEYALLRPLLSHMRHQMLISKLRDYCNSLSATMNTAGVTLGMKSSSIIPLEPAGRHLSRHARFLDTMLAPAESIIEIALPTGRKLEVKMRTHLAPPAFGTVFIASPIKYASGSVTPLKMPSFDAVTSAICDALTADLVELILDAHGPDTGTMHQWTSKDRTSGLLKSHNASLYVRTNVDTSLALRYQKQAGSASPAEDAAWVWHAGKMSEAPIGTGEVQEPRHLIDVVNMLSEKDSRPL